MTAHAPFIRLALLGTALVPVAARADDKPQVTVTPYVEVQQLAYADVTGNGDVLTYTTLAAGADATVATRRVEAQISARYEHQFAYSSQSRDTDYLSGIARAAVRLTPELQVEAGGLAERAHVYGNGAGAVPQVLDPGGSSRIYSVYAGPTLSGAVGDLTATAAYRLGYTRVTNAPGLVPGGVAAYTDGTTQTLAGSLGQSPHDRPFGWTVSGQYTREDGGQLGERFEDAVARADVIVPVSPTVALLGGAGYEHVKVSERGILTDAAGAPVLDGAGQLQVDPASPRLLAYDDAGLIFDVGVTWRPSDRTSLTATAGYRYGSDSYTGTFSWSPRANETLAIAVYDDVTSYGAYLEGALSHLPTSFTANRNPLSGDLSGCAYGGAGTACLSQLLGSTPAVAFRARGVTASYVTRLLGWDAGVALGYENRRYLAALLGGQAAVNGTSDQIWYADGYLGRRLDARSSLGANAYASLYQPGALANHDVLAIGMNAYYTRVLLRGLSANAAVGVDTVKQQTLDAQTAASALLGLRYSF